MIVAVPAFFRAEEAAASHSRELLLRAVSEASATPGISRVLVFGDDEKLLRSLSRCRIRGMARPVHAAGVPSPFGAEAAYAASGSSEDILILEPRNPVLDRSDLAVAAQRLLDGEAPYLLSAVEPVDHPCQGKQFFNLVDSGAVRIFENSHSAAFVSASLLSGKQGAAAGPVLRLRGLGFGAADGLRTLIYEDNEENLFLGFENFLPPNDLVLQAYDFAKGLAATARPGRDGLFRLRGLRLEPGSILIWSLLKEVPAGAYEFRLVFEPETAPWRADPSGLAPADATTGGVIRGRQDFPEVYEADGSLLGIRAQAPFPSETTLKRKNFGLFTPSSKRSFVIRNQLDVIKWEINGNAA
jgi:CMP-N-acetylneuraminic acid synthetase